MNILLLTHMYPYPPNDGGRIVTFNTIKYDVKYGNNLTVITLNEKQIKSELDDYCKVHIIEKDTNNDYMDMVKNLFSNMPYNLSKYYDDRVLKKIDELFANSSFDLVVIDHLHMAIYGKYIKEKYRTFPVILRQHNVESTIMERFYKNQSNFLIRSYAKLQFSKLYKFEKTIVELFDKCFMITEDDSTRITNMNPRAKTTVIPAGVDVEVYKPINEYEYNDGANIIFLGAMNWLPNEDGAIWFAENIFDKILKKEPKAKFYIVGKNPSDNVKKLHNGNNVIVTGFVEDDKEYISKANVFIVPLRIGGGMRIKILNAMSMGKCIVSTSIGAEGIKVTGEDICICDTEEEFANNVVQLLNNNERRKQIGINARNTIIEKYSWESICKRVNYEYKQLVGEINE